MNRFGNAREPAFSRKRQAKFSETKLNFVNKLLTKCDLLRRLLEKKLPLADKRDKDASP
mgnify:CR=1 FL=1